MVVVVGALFLVGGATAVFLYDRATAIDRSTPAVVVEQLLQAALAENDPARVALFTCTDWDATEAIAQLRSGIDSDVQVQWAPVSTAQTSDSAAQVTVRVTLAYPGEIAPSGDQVWTVTTRREQGWRACAVAKGSS